MRLSELLLESKQKPYVSMSKGKDGKTQYSVLDKFGDTAYSTNDRTLAMAYLKKNYKDLNECDVHDHIDEAHHAGLRAWFGKGKKGGKSSKKSKGRANAAWDNDVTNDGRDEEWESGLSNTTRMESNFPSNGPNKNGDTEVPDITHEASWVRGKLII